MIINKNYRLRLVDEKDLFFAKALREDFSTNQYLGTFCLLNEFKQRKWFESLQNDSSRMFLIFEIFEAEKWKSIGLVRISDIDLINRSMCVGGDIVSDYRGKGLSKDMYKLIFQFGFNSYNMNRLWLLVLDNNLVAQGLYKKMGFKEEGVQRSAVFKDGKYHDYIMMSILKGEYDDK